METIRNKQTCQEKGKEEGKKKEKTKEEEGEEKKRTKTEHTRAADHY